MGVALGVAALLGAGGEPSWRPSSSYSASYDPERDRVVLRRKVFGDRIRLQWSRFLDLAHEIQHSLQFLNGPAGSTLDAALAYRAVVEGDAQTSA
jgi:hypothetical protein